MTVKSRERLLDEANERLQEALRLEKAKVACRDESITIYRGTIANRDEDIKRLKKRPRKRKGKKVEFTCEQIGLDQDELQERVVQGLVDKILGERDDDFPRSEVLIEMDQRIEDAVNTKVKTVADEFVLPRIEALIEGFCLQRTNEWGEAKGEEMTFTEYLIRRAENYLTEKVDYDGKPKGARDSYSWKGHQTRISHMIDKHLHYEISRAMTAAVGEANKSIADGIEATCKIKLGEIASKLKVEVKTK